MKYMLNRKGAWDAYLSVHSFGNSWLMPWGYTDERLADYYDLQWKASIAVESIKQVNGELQTKFLFSDWLFIFLAFKKGSYYQIGQGSELYYLSCSSMDWAKSELGVKYSYVLELGPDGPDESAFVLTDSQNKQVVREAYAGIKAFLDSIC